MPPAEVFTVTDEPVGPRPWLVYFAWPAMLLLALILFELTAQPGLTAVVACAKFGWENFLAACWLRRTDPDPRRGRACFWFYVAAGLWRVSITAAVAMVLLAVVGVVTELPGNPGGQQPNNVSAMFVAVLFQALIGFVLSALTTVLAICVAIRHRAKIWVDTRVHRACRQGLWPPPYWRKNIVGRLVVTTGILLLIAVFMTLLLAPLLFGPAPGAHAAADIGIVCFFLVFELTVMFGGAFAVLAFRDRLKRSVIASTPWECWPELLESVEWT